MRMNWVQNDSLLRLGEVLSVLCAALGFGQLIQLTRKKSRQSPQKITFDLTGGYSVDASAIYVNQVAETGLVIQLEIRDASHDRFGFTFAPK